MKYLREKQQVKKENYRNYIRRHSCASLHKINPFKPSGVKWLHYKVFKAILV